LRISGLALWILVGVVGYGCWKASRNEAETTISPGGDPNAQTDNSPFKPIPEREPAANGDAAHEQPADAGITQGGWGPDGLPAFELIERSGKKITKADLLGKPWLVSFIFTRCAGPCPRITGQMRLMQDRLKDLPVNLVTITVDPKFDTPEILTKYANQFDADKDKWLFLTGERNEVFRLINTAFQMPVQDEFASEPKPGASGVEIAHSTNILLVNAEGRVIKKFNAQHDEEMSALLTAVKHEAETAKK
jgi:protein SCO1/2/putative membrane protein